MEDSIFVPILVGIFVNSVLFLLLRHMFKREARSAVRVTLLAAVMTFVLSFILTGWTGMGLGVISIGMVIGSLILWATSFTGSK